MFSNIPPEFKFISLSEQYHASAIPRAFAGRCGRGSIQRHQSDVFGIEMETPPGLVVYGGHDSVPGRIKILNDLQQLFLPEPR